MYVATHRLYKSNDALFLPNNLSHCCKNKKSDNIDVAIQSNFDTTQFDCLIGVVLFFTTKWMKVLAVSYIDVLIVSY